MERGVYNLRQSTSVSSLASMDRPQDDMTLASLHSIYSQQRATAIQHGRLKSHRSDERGLVVGMGEEREMEDRRPKSAHNQRRGRKKRRNLITANLSGTRYEVVRRVVEQLGFAVARDDDPSSYLFWNDSFVSTERISEMKQYQRINHFPGMGEITRKDCLARNMAKMDKKCPEDFKFVPKTWILPADHSLLMNYAKDLRARKKTKTFIIKPANGAQGHGIALYRNVEKIPPTEHFIVQEYIDKPFLMEGYKFDLRIYVLVTSCDPLRVFLFNDGLVRLSTEKYLPPSENNLSHLYMHLTNYSVNKHNEYYEKGASVDTGSKRSIRAFKEYLRVNMYNVPQIWSDISDMIVRTLIVSEPHILHAYRMCRPGAAPGSDSVCFEILGFDVLLDKNCKPWLLEINRSPSFGTDEQIDFDIKSALVEDTVRLLNIKLSDKRKNIQAQKAEAQKRLFRPSKRTSELADITDFEKKRMSIERRKEELKEMLARVRKAGSREEFENRNKGRFVRIFPVDDRIKQAKYVSLLSTAFTTFMAGRASSMQKEMQLHYINTLKEEDILDMLAECENDEAQGKLFTGGSKRLVHGPKPLQSMPVSQDTPETREDEDEDDSDESESGSPLMSRRARTRPHSTTGRESQISSNGTSSTLNSRPTSAVGQLGGRGSARPGSNRATSLTRLGNVAGKQTPLQRSTVDDHFLNNVVKEREEEMTLRTLQSLNDMRIKFPGKSDQEADLILDRLHENWKFHKPRIASYWLVKLDSIKRRKVIDIVRSNVRAVLQRTWRVGDVDNLRLYRVFSRVFNRLLWSHGQGLWNCFSSAGSATSWEAIFSKSSENVSEPELNCCRRIVQLCKDCLLIVYQFAAEAKSVNNNNNNRDNNSTQADSDQAMSQTTRDKSSLIAPNTQTLSQRYSKLYQQVRSEAH